MVKYWGFPPNPTRPADINPRIVGFSPPPSMCPARPKRSAEICTPDVFVALCSPNRKTSREDCFPYFCTSPHLTTSFITLGSECPLENTSMKFHIRGCPCLAQRNLPRKLSAQLQNAQARRRRYLAWIQFPHVLPNDQTPASPSSHACARHRRGRRPGYLDVRVERKEAGLDVTLPANLLTGSAKLRLSWIDEFRR